jgi:hypothetical protein
MMRKTRMGFFTFTGQARALLTGVPNHGWRIAVSTSTKGSFSGNGPFLDEKKQGSRGEVDGVGDGNAGTVNKRKVGEEVAGELEADRRWKLSLALEGLCHEP